MLGQWLFQAQGYRFISETAENLSDKHLGAGDWSFNAPFRVTAALSALPENILRPEAHVIALRFGRNEEPHAAEV